MKKQKRFSKKAYIYLGLVTMAAVSLFSKPIKRSFSALNKRLKNAVTPRINLRKNLLLSSQVPHAKKKQH